MHDNRGKLLPLMNLYLQWGKAAAVLVLGRVQATM
jgi:hypothetical protein